MSRTSLWGFLVAAFLVGAALGLGILLWQRSMLLTDARALQRKLDSAESSVSAAGLKLQDAQAALASSEASVTDLAARNTQLASDLSSATAALEAAKLVSSPVKVTERSVSPTSVEANKALTLTAKVQGRADKVQMKILGPSGGGYSKVYNLVRGTSSGGVDTWTRAVTAPSKAGTYRYFATAFVGTKAYEMPGTSAWTFAVK